MNSRVELVKIYECLCDVTRLRLLHVLTQGPLCVCHFQAVLRAPQVKISKHLAYLKSRGLVQCERQGNWMIYQLPEVASRELRANLACLQDCARGNATFQKDLARLKQLSPELARLGPCGCGPAGSTVKSRSRPSSGSKERLHHEKDSGWN
jgi:ArsR family transcriptional regulator